MQRESTQHKVRSEVASYSPEIIVFSTIRLDAITHRSHLISTLNLPPRALSTLNHPHHPSTLHMDDFDCLFGSIETKWDGPKTLEVPVNEDDPSHAGVYCVIA